jgi:hypothetical protein
VAGNWTPEQAASLAPDAASLKAAQGLASPRKWTLLGGDGEFIWGLAQGSGKDPYQSQIDLREPAFKCSCPSRKFPCKHGLGLLLIFASQPSAIVTGTKPAWVTEWAEKRAEKAAKQESKTSGVAEPEAAPDPAVQAKRREKRGANMAQGIAFLDGWLRDLVRQGIAGKSSADYAFWDAPARRLIDAQAPGLARRVRELGSRMTSAGHGDDRAIAELGRLYLLVAASGRRDNLPESWQQEIDTQLGWTSDQDELRKSDGVKGTWLVGAQTVREEEKIVTRTSYLFSPTGRTAKILEFSPAARPSVATLALGRWLEGELVFFPGVQTSRALWKTPPQDANAAALTFTRTCEEILNTYAVQTAENPFADPLPVLARLTPQLYDERWWLSDESGAAIPIAPGFQLGWELLACSGGHALPIVGLWDGFAFLPLTVLTDADPIQLAARASQS